MILFNAANVTVFHSSISINDSEQRCFDITHNLILNYIQVDKHQLCSSRDINKVVVKVVLRCEGARDMTEFFIADMVARSISYTFEN